MEKTVLDTKQKTFAASKLRTTVRLTEEEFERILRESQATGLSLPKLLKQRYFKSSPLKVLMSKEERHALAAELRRIGNNVNQIARRMNSGALEGWHPEFAEVHSHLS